LSSDVMIEADALTKRYGSLRALDKVSFEVHRGEVVGFLGPNGAGKSTTMRILTCFISATGGGAKVHGFDVFDDPLEVRRRLGYLPQRAPLYGEMNVWEYLHFVADMRGLEPSTFKRRMKGIVEVCGLAQVLGKDIRDLSHGYRQRVGLGQALVHDPPILILDEPTADLDPNEKAEVLRYIKEIGKDRTILLSTHNLSEVEYACARAIIVSKGRVVADGPLDEIRGRSQKVRYIVMVDEQRTLAGSGKKGPTATEVQAALSELPKVGVVTELPTDDKAHRFQLASSSTVDIRPDIFQLMVQKGWMLLELRRDAQSLEDVFKTLTKGDERKDRGRKFIEEEDEDEEETSAAANGGAAEGAAEEEDDDADDEDEEGDDESEEEAEAEAEKSAKKKKG
jgi:ABC-2 type transport system ATP-binding protein